jgi:hypothetical protein
MSLIDAPLTAQVKLDAPDSVLKEPGIQINLTGPRSWVGKSIGGDTLIQEEMTGVIMLAPKQSFVDYNQPVLTDFALSGTAGHWEVLTASPLFDGRNAIFHRQNNSSPRHTAESTANWWVNPSCMIGLYSYQADDDTLNYVEFTWGGNSIHPITLRIGTGYSPEIDFEGSTFILDKVNPISAKDFNRHALRLWVYFIRDTLVVHSNFMDTFFWRPPTSIWDKPTWVDDLGVEHIYLTRFGTFKISGSGMFAFSAVPNKYETSGSYLTSFTLPYTSTQPALGVYTPENFVVGGVVAQASGSLRKSNDSADYETGDQTGAVKITFGTSHVEWTPYILSYKIEWPPKYGSKATDQHEPYLEVCEETRTWDATADSMVVEIYDDGSYGELDLRPNMRFEVSINNFPRFVGYTEEPAGESRPGGRWFQLRLVDRFHRLQNSCLMSEFNADDMAPEEAIRELIWRAGIPDAEIEVAASGYKLCSSGSEIDPANLFLAGGNIHEAIMSIKETWLGNWRFYADANGKFVLKPWAETASRKTVYKGSDYETLNIDNPDLLVRGNIKRWTDESRFKNFITVMGVDANVNPIVAYRQNAASVTDPSNPNYIGEYRVGAYADVTLNTQKAVNDVADMLAAKWGHIYRYYHFTIKYDPELFPGDVLTIYGEGRVKITDLDCSITKRAGEMTITGEYIGA